MAAEKKSSAVKSAKPADKASKTAPPSSPLQTLEPKRAPQRPAGKRKAPAKTTSSRVVRTLSSLMTLVMLFIVVVAGAGYLINAQFEGRGPLDAAKGFVVAKGKGRLDIAERSKSVV